MQRNIYLEEIQIMLKRFRKCFVLEMKSDQYIDGYRVGYWRPSGRSFEINFIIRQWHLVSDEKMSAIGVQSNDTLISILSIFAIATMEPRIDSKCVGRIRGQGQKFRKAFSFNCSINLKMINRMRAPIIYRNNAMPGVGNMWKTLLQITY